MKPDAVMLEAWKTKERHAARYGFDVHAMGQALMNRQRDGARQLRPPPPKPCRAGAGVSSESPQVAR